MVIIRGLSDFLGRLGGLLSDIWNTAEPIVILIYLAMFLFISLFVWRQSGKALSRWLSHSLFCWPEKHTD